MWVTPDKDNCYFFYGGKLSQWYPSVFEDRNGVTYCCAEQFMMASKAFFFQDDVTRSKILKETHPPEIKRLGRQVRNFDPAAWESVSLGFVVTGNYYKFSSNTILRDFLLSTGERYIAEASPTDAIWGIGIGRDDPRHTDPINWQGQNKLGIALMLTRALIK